MTDTVTELIDAGGDITTTLTVPERARLQECEEVIEKNIRGFLATGHALAEIRDRRLYRETHKTFERYCKKQWDLGKTHAYRQIASYEVVQNLYASSLQSGGMSPIGDKNLQAEETSPMGDKIEGEPKTALGALVEIVENELGQKAELISMSGAADDGRRMILPQNERQLRPLTKLSPDDQIKAWDMVREQITQGKELTTYVVSQAVKEVKGEVVKKKVAKKKEDLQATRLVSKIFATQYQVLLDIISAEKKLGWKQSSKKEVLKWIDELRKIADMEL